ncbi:MULTISPECIES: MlaD family protein [unclassified Mycobacterium]|uniref:MlaD family protein n=1 Tax=unclassified Mycobacterium TaxID=2642494 RepID=UPI0029C7A2BD|nr:MULTISPECIES: MCE family protein [unclassified Mycobacterium]
MTQRLESAGKEVSTAQHFLRGVVLVVAAALLTAFAVAKSEGVFNKSVGVTVLLTNIGDGLPAKSDVKFRGALVGVVDDVTPATSGQPNTVRVNLDPRYADMIPSSVTARVVPSNVFAVSSIQLIDNGAAPALRRGAEIFEDQSLATVQFQTALTKLRDIVAATSRPAQHNTLGILAAVAEATNGRGDSIAAAGGGAKRIVHELNAVMASDGTPSTLGTLSEALQGLQTSAPDLLDSLHQAIVPMRTIAEKRDELANFLSTGLNTLSTAATAFENNTDHLIVITSQLSPVLGVIADGGSQFSTIGSRIEHVSNKFMEEVWKPGRNVALGKFMVVFTPNRMYTRQDCPRYGQMEGPSCRTAPETALPPAMPQGLNPRNYPIPPEIAGGNVGSVGSPEERQQLQQILGPDTNPASELLLGPVARGNTVQLVPDQGVPPDPGPALPAEAPGPPPDPLATPPNPGQG